MKLTTARYGILILVIVGAILISGCVQAPADQPTIRLEIPDGALPEGVQKTNITIKTISENDLPKNVSVLEETDPITTIRLEPDGLQFLKNVIFALAFSSHYLFSPTVYHISDSKVEEVKDLNVTYDEDKEIITLKGEISHFSTLAVRQGKSVKEIDEFVAKAKEDIAESGAKAESSTYYSEKAKYYKEMVDKALDYHEKATEKWGDDLNLPQLGSDSLGESSAMQNYHKNILADIDFRVNNERNPEKRFDLLKERMKITDETHTRWQSGAFDERMAPQLGKDGLGESTLLRDQGESIIDEMQQLIGLEEDTAKKNALKDRLAEIVNWLIDQWFGGGFDERMQPNINKLLSFTCKAETMLREECDKTCPLSSLCTIDPTQTTTDCYICNPCPDDSVPTEFCERTHCGLKGEVKCKMVRTAQQCSTCEIESPLCTTNWDCTEFAPEPCPSSGIQKRTCTDTNNCGTEEGKPVESQGCTPACIPNWSCTAFSPSPCPTSGMQTRTCTDTNNCGTTTGKPAESQTCTPPAPDCTWTCGSWSECSSTGTQTRTCSSSPSPCTGANPNPTSQTCIPEPEPTCDTNALRSCLSVNCVGVYGPGGSANCPERCKTGDTYYNACLDSQCNGPYQSCITACHTSNPPCTLDEVYSVLQEISGG